MSGISCAAPQGSISGPTLFICYNSDLEQHLLFAEPSLFADNTALTIHGNNLAEISQKLKCELENVNNYFRVNKFKINRKKTKCMLFHSTCEILLATIWPRNCIAL